MPIGQLEGSLPPCMRIAVFEGRRATWHDYSCVAEPEPWWLRFAVVVSPIVAWEPAQYHPDVFAPWGTQDEVEWKARTDDPEEAERLWLEAQEVLRNPEEQSE